MPAPPMQGRLRLALLLKIAVPHGDVRPVGHVWIIRIKLTVTAIHHE